MCALQEPQISSIGNTAEDIRGSDRDSKAKPGRFCASFMDYFALDWLSKVFHPENKKTESTVSAMQPNSHDTVISADAHRADLVDDGFFRVEIYGTTIRHSLSLAENTVR